MTRAVGVAVALVLGAVLLGCGDSTDDSGLAELDASPTSSAASVATSAAAEPSPTAPPQLTVTVEAQPADPSQEQVVDTYRHFWEAFAMGLGGGDVTGLYQVLVPPALTTLEQGVKRQVDEQVFTRGEWRIEVTSVAIDGEQAQIEACLDQSSAWDEGPDGATTPPSRPRSPWPATLVSDGTNWFIRELPAVEEAC